MNDRNVTNSLDPIAMARFLVLPDAARLLEAFAAIPPGPLRDSVIAHAEVIAQTYSSAPAANRMPDPLAAISTPAFRSAGALPSAVSRTGRAPPTESPEAAVVKMRLAGRPVTEITEALGITTSAVYTALRAARKAGVNVAKPTPVGSKDSTRWALSLDDLSPQGISQVAKAARVRGITAQEYMDRRQLALKLALEGKGWEAILKATGERSAKVVSAWLSNARGAGYRVPYVAFIETSGDGSHWNASHPEPEPIPDAIVAPVGRVFQTMEEMSASSAAAVRAAATRRGMTVQAYTDMREAIVRYRMDGKSHAEIVALTGQTAIFVKDILTDAHKRGVQYPPAVREPLIEPPITAQRRSETG